MVFVLMHQSIVPNDAIGRDLMEMHRILRDRHICYVCGEFVFVATRDAIDPEKASKMLADPASVAIYHHSNAWEAGEQIVGNARGKVIFKYHNITPPNYFWDTPQYRSQCLQGREQTYRFVRRFPDAFWLTDSLYNLQELGIEGIVRHAVVPPFLTIADDNVKPDENVLRQLVNSAELQILTVGRFVRNKGHLFLLRIVEAYRQKYDDHIRLFVVGKRDSACNAYFDEVSASIKAKDLEGNICYLGEIDSPRLLSYFLGCDAYICASEHEGFCVPVVEAQCMSLPVVARATSAVPETLGPQQVLLGESPDCYADGLRRLRTDRAFRRAVIAAGRRNYLERFTNDAIEQRFSTALKSYLGTPI